MNFEGPDYDSGENMADCPDGHYDCKDCEWLMDAVRDLEEQRRETMEAHNREISLFGKMSPAEFAQCEKRFLSRMNTLELRRNSSLDVLAKHQALEHL